MNEEFIGKNFPRSSIWSFPVYKYWAAPLLSISCSSVHSVSCAVSRLFENKVPLVSLQTTWLFSMWLPGVLWSNTSTWCLWSWATLSLWMLINPLLIIFLAVEESISNIRRACVLLTCALLLASVMSSGFGSLQILCSGCDFGFMLSFLSIFIFSSVAFQSCSGLSFCSVLVGWHQVSMSYSSRNIWLLVLFMGLDSVSWKKSSKSKLFLLFICMHVHVCIPMCVCVYMWSPAVDDKCLLQSPSTGLFWDRVLCWILGSMIRLWW